MFIRTQNGRALINFDKALHLYATENGGIMARMTDEMYRFLER